MYLVKKTYKKGLMLFFFSSKLTHEFCLNRVFYELLRRDLYLGEWISLLNFGVCDDFILLAKVRQARYLIRELHITFFDVFDSMRDGFDFAVFDENSDYWESKYDHFLSREQRKIEKEYNKWRKEEALKAIVEFTKKMESQE